MIAGARALTASAIARMMKLSRSGQVLSFTGQELQRMNKQEFAEAAASGVVFARVAPEQKLQLVKALQSQGEIVAITGDWG